MKYMIMILVVLFFASWVSGDQYVMTKSVFSTAGGASSSSSYILKDAVGQSVTGQASSSTRIEQAGFFNYSKKKIIGAQEIDPLIPKVFSLSAPYPNPVANNVIVRYGVPRTSHISIVVYNVAGRVVKTLVHSEQKPGFHTLRWDRVADGGKVTQGVYFIRMVTPEFKSTKKLILMK